MTRTTKLIAAGTMLLGASTVLHAQSNDALLNKLVSKGILSSQEADEMKKEADAGFDKAYRSRTGLPDWVTQLKFYGDVRMRYDHLFFENDDVKGPNRDRDRWRFRLRTGATVSMKDNLELGFRFITADPDNTSVGTFSQGGNPNSGNQTMRDNASKKFLFVDLAYGKWTPIKNDQWTVSASVGKIENPYTVSDIVFDPDYTPEGGALTIAYKVNDMHTFKLVGAGFAIDENNQGTTDDPFLIGAQLRWDAKWSKCVESSVGITALKLTDAPNLGNATIPNVDVGNSRFNTGTRAGRLMYDYTPIVADASITYFFDAGTAYPGLLPIKFGGTYMYNPSAPSRNHAFDAGIVAGKSGKKGSWEFSYRYKYIEGDATFEEFPDDDFGAYYAATPAGFGRGAGFNAGTNLKGHVVKASYSPYDALALGVTYFATELISNPSSTVKEKDSATGRLFVDATWKF